MLTIAGRPGRTCSGPTRRELLQVGGIGLLGLSLSNVLALAEAQAAPTPSGGFGKAKSVIFLFLQGGPSHIDIWDPKPDAPENIRGAFRAIDTAVPGIQVSELVPKLARQLDKATLV